MSLNEKLLHHAIGHHIRVQRYGAGSRNDFQKSLDDAHGQVREVVRDSDEIIESQNTDSKEYAALLALLLLILSDMQSALQADIEDSLKSFIANEVENELAIIEGETGLGLIAPSEDALNAIITDVAFQGRYLEQWVDDLARGDFSRIQSTLVAGMQRGNTAREIADAMEFDAFKTTSNQLSNLTRTLYNGVTNWARLEVMKANADLVGAVMWNATLDEATCPICAELDGQVFPIEEVDPPPAHPSCRCFIVAIFGDAENMLESKRHGKKFKRMKSTHRAKFTGKVPQKKRFATWLREQSVAVQEEALGPTRARLFRVGKLNISKFVSNNRHILTIDQLKQRDGAAFERAGLIRGGSTNG